MMGCQRLRCACGCMQTWVVSNCRYEARYPHIPLRQPVNEEAKYITKLYRFLLPRAPMASLFREDRVLVRRLGIESETSQGKKVADILSGERKKWRRRLPKIGVPQSHLLAATGTTADAATTTVFPSPLPESASSTAAFLGEFGP